MPEIDQSFLQSLEQQLQGRKKEVRGKKLLLTTFVSLGIFVVLAVGGVYGYRMLTVHRELPPELPPPSPVASLPLSQAAKDTGKEYYLEHTEIQSALAEYARQLIRGELDLRAIGPLFQPIADFSWEKWYYDTVPVREGFKTLKDPQPTPHVFTEDRPIITYTIQPGDVWGAWGVGIKYAAALGVDIKSPANQELASLVAAYVWLQSERRIIYEKSNYFDDKGNFHPQKYKKNINLLRAGDVIRFPHLSEQSLRELAQRPQPYLEGTVPSPSAPTSPPAAAPPPTPTAQAESPAASAD
jgi:hypothetical protein